jgi:hypothetical protein
MFKDSIKQQAILYCHNDGSRNTNNKIIAREKVIKEK